jgi:adenosine deaminase
VDALGAERIGHGIRSIEDERLVLHLCERRVMLDICPVSNVRTGAVASLAAHPLRRLYEAGVRLSINTDDPTFFGTTLCNELRLAAHVFGFTGGELAQIMLDSIDASFLPPGDQLALKRQFAGEIAALRAQCGV